MDVLSIGSVVALKGRKEKRMITGYLRTLPDGRVFDYASVPFPIGAGDPQSGVLFNAEAIETILFEGYHDEEFPKVADFLEKVRPVMEKAAQKAGEKANEKRTALE